MVVFGGLIDLGIAFLIAVALAEYTKVRRKSEKGWNWIALAGVMFLFAGTFTATMLFTSGSWLESVYMLGPIFEIIGWLIALIGTLFITYETLFEK